MSPADSNAAEGMPKAMASGHYGTAEQVVDNVLFLAGLAGKHISGAGLDLDGSIKCLSAWAAKKRA